MFIEGGFPKGCAIHPFLRVIHLFIHPMFIVKNPVCVLDSRDKTVNKTIKRKIKNPRVYILVHEAHTNLGRCNDRHVEGALWRKCKAGKEGQVVGKEAISTRWSRMSPIKQNLK